MFLSKIISAYNTVTGRRYAVSVLVSLVLLELGSR